MNDKNFYRINDKIRISPIIVIDENGNNLGSIPTFRAKVLALNAGLDLVEVSPNSRPPVCRIMDFGKFKYQQEVKNKKQYKKQSQTKEIRLSCTIEDHDLETKSKLANKFLLSGHKVLIKLEFKRRQNDHKEIGYSVMNKFLDLVKDNGDISKHPTLDGKSLHCLLDSKKNERKN